MAIIFRYGKSENGLPSVIVAGGFQKDCAAYRKTLLDEALGEAGLSGEASELFRHESGQPFVRSGSDTYAVSLSHTKDFIVLALSLSGPVGIDTERDNRQVRDTLKSRIIAKEEPEHELEIPLLKLWTIKEAFLKMTGTGLRFPMNKVNVQPEDHEGHFFNCRAVISDQHIDARAVSLIYQDYRITFCCAAGTV